MNISFWRAVRLANVPQSFGSLQDNSISFQFSSRTKIRIIKMIALRFLSLLLLVVGAISADDDYAYGNKNNGGDDQYQKQGDDQYQKQGDDAWQQYQTDDYSSSSSSYQSYSNGGNYNGNYKGSSVTTLQNCQGATIEVEAVKILCDSPYAYYYGNGAHRGSEVCDYGDMATIMVYFNVVNGGIQSIDDVYMTMGVYANKVQTELLFAAMNVDLNDLVGSAVRRKGSYTFTMRIMLDKIYGDNSQFVPSFEFGFSSQADEGYNLGGVNINCNYDSNVKPYSDFFYKSGKNSSARFGAGPSLHIASLGMWLGILLLGSTFGFFYYKKTQQANDVDPLIDEENKGYVDAEDNSLFK